MIVLMDLEWVENRFHHVTPTQLAAMRVSETWDYISMFSSLCRPRDSSFYQWNHVAYSGSVQNDFLFAPSARTAFERFIAWLQPDDILLWWSQDAPQHFAGLMKIVGLPKLKNKSHAIQTAFQAFVTDGRKTKGGLYQLAKDRQILLPKPEHRATNDVRVMQKLLQKVQFQVDYLHQQIPSKEAREKIQYASISAYQFHVDPQTRLIHKKGCDLLPGETKIIGCHDLASGLGHNARPCPVCCKQVWKEHVAARNIDTIQRSNCNYFYLPSGKVFHRPDCRTILYSNVLPTGTVYYKTCEKTGRTPCKICNPTPNDDPTPEQLEVEDHIITKRQSLTNTEKQALKRFEQASKERASLDLSDMTQQQRSDSITLTATRFAFWAVTGYSTFHTRNCPKLNTLTGVKGFARYNDALHAGFQPCRQCKPSPKQDAILSIPIYNQTRDTEKLEDVVSICEAKGYRCTISKNELTIETAAGRWIVDVVKRPIFIQHQHTSGSTKGESELHWQPRMFLSLMDVVQYIEKHDLRLTKE